MKFSPGKAARTITADEVAEWFGKSRRARLGQAQYRKLAAYLTKLRWPDDPPDPPDSPWLVKETIETGPDPWWNFSEAANAAKVLNESIPAMLRHWTGLLWAPETRGGYAAIKALEGALVVARPYIDWPFGRYERQSGRKQPKKWHLPAILIAKAIVQTMIEAGQHEPSIVGNSIVARVTSEALMRMKFINAVTPHAVAAHLTRWDKKYGLTPTTIAILTTKQRTPHL